MAKPLVSLVMPAFNADRYIMEAVNSVVSQSLDNWELIIVNDGSTDSTRVLLEQIDDVRIHVKHQENQGVSAARNAGLAVANGEFITFLDADDFLPPRSLEVRTNYLLEHPDVDLVDGVISVRDELLKVEKRSYQPYYLGLLLPRLLKLDDSVFFGPFYMFRSSLLGQTRFFEGMTHAEDLLFFITLASRNNIKYSHVKKVVYHYRVTKSSAMSKMEGLEKGYLELLREVRKIDNVSFYDVVFLRLKIARILFLSWNARNQLGKGIVAATRAIFMTC